MKGSAVIENAFQRIRTATGQTDVQEIVHQFLTREQTYAQLLTAVTSNEKKYEQLKIENEEKKDKQHTLNMDQEGKEKQ